MEAAKPVPDAVKPESKPAPKPAPARYGPVKTGENLRSIAGQVKAADVTLEQMMAGLFMTNKGAFIDNNMNLLKRGAVLNVPTSEAVHLQASPSQATRMIQNHVEEWHAYRSKVAEVAGEAPDSRTEGPAAAGKITPKVEDKTPPASAPKDVLKLSKGEPAAGAKPDAKTQERLQALEEELASKARALQESQDRVSQLERAVRDMQQLLELKSQEATKAPPPAAPAPAQPEQPAQPPAAEPAPPAAAAPASAPLPPAAEEEESSWFSTFIRNPIYIGGVVAAGLLSGLLWMMMVGSRRRQGLNKFEDSIMTGGEFKSGAVFTSGDTGAGAGATVAAANTEGSMLLTDFSRLGLGAIDTHEVDPIAEAEVYMAYGRDAQAEEILKEALEKDSSRHEIALKLLEIYAARKDPLAFETTASELYAGLGGQDTPIWQRAADMGRSIDPENPLYRMAQGQSFASAPEAAPAETPVQARDVADDLGGDVPDDLGMEFESPSTSMRKEEPPAKSSVEPESDMGLDFASSFDVPTPSEAAPAAEMEPEPEAPASDESALEFEPSAFEMGVPGEELPEVSTEPEEALDLTLPEVEVQAEEEPVPEFHVDEAQSESLAEPVAEEVEAIDLEAPAEMDVAEEDQAMPDLDFGSIDLELDAATSEAPVEEIVEASLPEVGTDLDFEPEAKPAEAVEEAQAEPAEPAPASGIDPELWEEVNTKLDLAKAYLEMGDREGAREILQEVTQEGDDMQKAEAEKLLSEAG